MNLQVIISPDGDAVWVSGPLPGAVHDLAAARIWGILAELAGCGLVVLAAPACEKARAPRQILAGANRWDGSPVLPVGAYLT